MSELKPCPFCGGEATHDTDGSAIWVICKKCGARCTSSFFSGKKGVRIVDERWNRRAPSAQPQLEECPIYGGMCGYPSNLCYECPRHEGAKERPQWWQPFAQPQRRKGKWIHDGYDIPHGVDWMHCSVCGRREPHVPAAMTNFCPTCGAWMLEEPYKGEQG